MYMQIFVTERRGIMWVIVLKKTPLNKRIRVWITFIRRVLHGTLWKRSFGSILGCDQSNIPCYNKDCFQKKCLTPVTNLVFFSLRAIMGWLTNMEIFFLN